MAGKQCTDCGGSGETRTPTFLGIVVKTCRACGGTGKKLSPPTKASPEGLTPDSLKPVPILQERNGVMTATIHHLPDKTPVPATPYFWFTDRQIADMDAIRAATAHLRAAAT